MIKNALDALFRMSIHVLTTTKYFIMKTRGFLSILGSKTALLGSIRRQIVKNASYTMQPPEGCIACFSLLFGKKSRKKDAKMN